MNRHADGVLSSQIRVQRFEGGEETIQGCGHNRQRALHTGKLVVQRGVQRVTTGLEVGDEVINGWQDTRGEA